MLYFRMILIMGVSLYTSRIVLNELGVDDYGVYVVVGGVISMLSFLNACMTTSTQRYLNYELGNPEGTLTRLKEIFSTSLTIHIVIALIVLALAETFGLWFVNNKLVIPADSKFGANVVYQTSALIFCLNILRVPFNAAIIAHEHMQIYAWISIVEAILKLLVSYALILVPTMKLAWYGIFLAGTQIVIAGWYIAVCHKKFAECRLRISYRSALFKEMSQFAGWNLFGSIAWIARGQGMGIMLNIFFGPALNAAKGVAEQVSGSVSNLNSNFQLALNPQITKNYASSELEKMWLLTYRGIKFSSLLMWCLCLPIMLSASVILSLWLKTVPPYTSLFVILVMCDCIVSNLFGSPLMTALSATGNIRNYQIAVSAVLLLILPLAYIALRNDCPPEVIFYLNIMLNMFAGITRLCFCKRMLGFSVMSYIRTVMTPFLCVVFLSGIISLCVSYLLHPYGLSDIMSLVVLTSISVASVFLTTWYCGLSGVERNSIKKMVRSRISVRS